LAKVVETRKYEETWKSLKKALTVVVSLEHTETLSPTRIEAQLKTIRKAVQKEKYCDWFFKDTYPNAEIESFMVLEDPNNPNHKPCIVFKLVLNKHDLTRLFK
jgi:hypothetical protein